MCTPYEKFLKKRYKMVMIFILEERQYNHIINRFTFLSWGGGGANKDYDICDENTKR